MIRTITLPAPHLGQATVRREAKRFNILSAGRRWRKSTHVMAIAAEAMAHGKTILWGAPTFNQVRIGWDELQKAGRGLMRFHVQRMTATLPETGGQVIFRSLDNPDNARGYTADGVIIDEAGDVRPEAWYEVLRPTLMDTGGWLWAIGTPKGRNWFWREWLKSHSRDDYMSWQIPTVGCHLDMEGNLTRKKHPLENPDIPWEEIVNIFESSPLDTFRQEILAEFLENEGSVFRNIDSCINAEKTVPAEHKDHFIVAGIDWGRQNDFTAISIGCKNCMRELDLVRFNKIGYIYQRKRLKELIKKWNVRATQAESNAMGLPNIEQLQKDGLKVIGVDTNIKTKRQMIEGLALHFDKKSFQFLSIPYATAELEAYERIISEATGNTRYSAPSGMNDDTVIARALMAKGLRSTTLTNVEALPTHQSPWFSKVNAVNQKFTRWRY